MRDSVVLAVLAATLAGTATAQTTVSGALTGDTYSYWVAANGGERDRAPVFAFEQAPPPAPQFFFDYHDGQLILQWDIALPPALSGVEIEVVSARIEIWNVKDAEWDPAAEEVRLFAAGFSGTNGFTEETWSEDTPYVGPTAVAAGVRDPFPRDLVTGLSASDAPFATPWAIADVDPGYTGVPANDPDDAFKLTFILDVNDFTIQSKLRDDVASGVSSWIIASTYAAAQPPATAFYPELITREGVGETGYGTSQQAPVLILEVQERVTSANSWVLYR